MTSPTRFNSTPAAPALCLVAVAVATLALAGRRAGRISDRGRASQPERRRPRQRADRRVDRARPPLPAGINRPADELHPSMTPDPRRIVFERVDPAVSTVRVIVVDLQNGRQADLFSAFEAATSPPVTPSITPDGRRALTGDALVVNGGVGTNAALITTDVSRFPDGPFPHDTSRTLSGFGDSRLRTSLSFGAMIGPACVETPAPLRQARSRRTVTSLRSDHRPQWARSPAGRSASPSVITPIANRGASA